VRIFNVGHARAAVRPNDQCRRRRPEVLMCRPLASVNKRTDGASGDHLQFGPRIFNMAKTKQTLRKTSVEISANSTPKESVRCPESKIFGAACNMAKHRIAIHGRHSDGREADAETVRRYQGYGKHCDGALTEKKISAETSATASSVSADESKASASISPVSAKTSLR